MIRYKIDVVSALKSAGYTPSRIKNEKLIGESYMSQLRKSQLVSWNCMDKLCKLLECDISDIIEYVPDSDDEN